MGRSEERDNDGDDGDAAAPDASSSPEVDLEPPMNDPVEIAPEEEEEEADPLTVARLNFQKKKGPSITTRIGNGYDYTLRLLRLRRDVKPFLRELTVRNSVKGNEHLHLNVLWPCPCLILKKKLQAFVSVRATHQRLVFEGRILKDEEKIPESCFAQDSKDGKDLVPHIWMINVGASLDRYQAKKDADGKAAARGSSTGKIHPEEELEEEEGESAEDLEMRGEVKKCVLDLVQRVEMKTLEENLAAAPAAAKKERFDLRKELSLIGCAEYAAGLKSIGFFDRGAFSCLQDEHLVGHPLFVHGKARKKMVGLAAAYRSQLQYEEQQLKTHLNKLNELSFAKK